MRTHMTDMSPPPLVDPAAQKALLETLRLLLAPTPALTLLVLARAAAQATTEAGQMDMNELEQLIRASVRQTDVVLRCGEESYAVVLLGADDKVALRILLYLRWGLSVRPDAATTLEVGLASAPAEARDAETLLTLALTRRVKLPLAADQPRQQATAFAALEEFEWLRQSFALGHAGRHRRKRARAADLAPPALPDVASPLAILVQERARELGVPYLPPPRRISSSLRNLLPPEVMRQLRCLPVGRERNALTVALADPTDSGALLQLEQITGMTIFPVMTDPEALEHLTQAPPSRRSSQTHTAVAPQ